MHIRRMITRIYILSNKFWKHLKKSKLLTNKWEGIIENFILKYIILGNVIPYPKLFSSEVLTGKSGNMYYTKGGALEFQIYGNELR